VLITVIVAEFLGELKSIARLLIATNNHESRDILLRALKVTPVSNFNAQISFSPACVAWLRQHRISVRKMVVSRSARRNLLMMSDLPVDQLRQLDTVVVEENIFMQRQISEEVFASLVSPSSALFLKHLSFDGLAIGKAECIGEVLKKLETLHLAEAYHGESETTPVMAKIGKGCPHITALKTSLYMNDAALNNFADHNLRVLHLTRANITTDYLASRLRGPVMATLEELVLGENYHYFLGNSFSSDDVLYAIAANCHHMRKVALPFGVGATGAGLAELADKCPMLSSLRLAFKLGGLTDEGVSQLAVGAFPSLIEAEVAIQTDGDDLWGG
jgi:hypothetical protein